MKEAFRKIASLCNSALSRAHSYNDLKACIQTVLKEAETAAKVPSQELKDQLDLVETMDLILALERRSLCLVVLQDPKTNEAPKITAFGGYSCLGLIQLSIPHLKRMFGGNSNE